MKKINRDSRKNIANDTLNILEQGYYVNAKGENISIEEMQAFAVENTQLYTPQSSNKVLNGFVAKQTDFETVFEVTDETTLEAVRRLIVEDGSSKSDVFCLNFASAKNPGGGFLGGSQAQEESIARSTGLYPCQLEASEYYEVNRQTKTAFYTDYMIYSPQVPILKDEAGKLLDKPLPVSILTAPAVNAGVVKQREPHRLDEVEEVMRRRIDKVLAIAAENNHAILVLGAWGCGVFRNDPNDMAKYFADTLIGDGRFKNQFEKIVFAIYGTNERFIRPFRELFE